VHGLGILESGVLGAEGTRALIAMRNIVGNVHLGSICSRGGVGILERSKESIRSYIRLHISELCQGVNQMYVVIPRFCCIE
jgi:hypothetical protein